MFFFCFYYFIAVFESPFVPVSIFQLLFAPLLWNQRGHSYSPLLSQRTSGDDDDSPLRMYLLVAVVRQAFLHLRLLVYASLLFRGKILNRDANLVFRIKHYKRGQLVNNLCPQKSLARVCFMCARYFLFFFFFFFFHFCVLVHSLSPHRV